MMDVSQVYGGFVEFVERMIGGTTMYESLKEMSSVLGRETDEKLVELLTSQWVPHEQMPAKQIVIMVVNALNDMGHFDK